LIDNLEAYDGLALILVTDVELVKWDRDELAETVEGDEADELLDEDVDACRREMLGSCGRALSDALSVTGWRVPSMIVSSPSSSLSEPSSTSSSSVVCSESPAAPFFASSFDRYWSYRSSILCKEGGTRLSKLASRHSKQ
jgi:hypothetical protein